MPFRIFLRGNKKAINHKSLKGSNKTIKCLATAKECGMGVEPWVLTDAYPLRQK